MNISSMNECADIVYEVIWMNIQNNKFGDKSVNVYEKISTYWILNLQSFAL